MRNIRDYENGTLCLHAMRSAGIIQIAAALLLFGIVSGFICFYADDFYYATFFREGFVGFWQRTAEYYMTMNGRALIHFLMMLFCSLGQSYLLFLIR